MAAIFVSYSRKDSEIVHQIVAELEQEGFDLWIDRDGIESGDAFKHVIVKALNACKVVVFFASEASNSSPWTEKEIGIAVDNKLPIIPIRLDHSQYSDAVRFDLTNLDYIDLTAPEKMERMMARLKSSLRKKLGLSDAEPAKKSPARQETVMSSASNYDDIDASTTSKSIRRVEGRFSKKYHYVDLITGRRVIKERFEDCDETSTHGFARAKKDGKWGCIDTTGNVVIPFEYDGLSEIDTYLVARRGFQEGIIDLHNRIILPFEYPAGTLGLLDDDRAFTFLKNGLYGIIANNRFIVPCDYDRILKVCPGVYELHNGNECRLCDIEGRIASQPIWNLGKGTSREWVYFDSGDSPFLLVGLNPEVLPHIEPDGSIKDLDRCGILSIKEFPSISPMEKVVREANGRVFVCIQNRWGEIKLPVFPEVADMDWDWVMKTIEEDPVGSHFKITIQHRLNKNRMAEEFIDFYLQNARPSILSPFIYESIDDLKRQNG